MSPADYRGGGFRSHVNRDRARERAPRQSGPAKNPRVLLFVQGGAYNGDRPIYQGRVYRTPSTALGEWAMRDRTRLADRWWIVECENAGHGRLLIEAVANGLGPHRDTGQHADDVLRTGRVLAQGSREPESSEVRS